MHFEESLRFVRMKKDEYDLIIVDCADPYGPAEGLFTREFYGNCFKALHDDGFLSISMRVHITVNIQEQYKKHINIFSRCFLIVRFINVIYHRIPQVIGCLVLPLKSMTQ